MTRRPTIGWVVASSLDEERDASHSSAAIRAVVEAVRGGTRLAAR